MFVSESYPVKNMLIVNNYATDISHHSESSGRRSCHCCKAERIQRKPQTQDRTGKRRAESCFVQIQNQLIVARRLRKGPSLFLGNFIYPDFSGDSGRDTMRRHKSYCPKDQRQTAAGNYSTVQSSPFGKLPRHT